MSDYLKIIYDEGTLPYTEYPEKLISYLFNAFEMKKGMTLLESSCGRSEHLRLFKASGLNVYELDLSPKAPLLAKDLKISVCDLESNSLPYTDNHFDEIYSKSFFEHIRNPGKFLKEAYSVLKSDGLILSMVPHWVSQYRKFYDYYTHVSPFTIVSLKNIQLVIGCDNVEVYKFRQFPIVCKYPILNNFCALIGPLIPVRTTIPLLRWSRELVLIGTGRKPIKS